LINDIPDYSHLYAIDPTLPKREVLIDHLQKEYQAHHYVQFAVCYHDFAHALLSVATQWLAGNTLHEQSLALHYIRALGARYQAKAIFMSFQKQEITHLQQSNPLWDQQQSIAEHIPPRINYPQNTRSFFPNLVYYYCQPTVSDTYLAVLIDLLPENHFIRLQAIDWAYTRGISPHLVWQAWPKNRSHLPLIQFISAQLLIDTPDALSTLAVRLVLMHPNEILAFCMAIRKSELSKDHQQSFAHALHKQCKRTGNILIWGYAQRILKF
jgi:hypothetical protein